MPWRVTSPMYQRQRFVLDAEHTPASFAELCPWYDISRKTGYRWLVAEDALNANTTCHPSGDNT